MAQQKLSLLGTRLEALRKEHGLSRSEFARRIGVKRQAQQHWDSGRNLPNGQVLLNISRSFGVSIDWLLGFDVPEKRNEQTKRDDVHTAAAEYLATEVAAALRNEGWANVLAEYVPDGGAFLRAAVQREVDEIRVAWRDAETLALSWEPLISELQEWPVATRDNLSAADRRRFLRISLKGKQLMAAWRAFHDRFRSAALRRAERKEYPDKIPPQFLELSAKARGRGARHTERTR